MNRVFKTRRNKFELKVFESCNWLPLSNGNRDELCDATSATRRGILATDNIGKEDEKNQGTSGIAR